MGANARVTVRVVMAAGLLVRGANAMLGSEIAAAVGYSVLRLGARCSGAAVK